MRRTSLCLLTALALTSTAANAHSDDLSLAEYPRKNMLLINVGELFGGALSLEYERGIAPWLGINVCAGVAFFPSVWSPVDFNSALNLDLGFRFHFIRHAPGGLWFGPYATFSAGLDRDLYQWLMWGFGAAAGYNFVFGRHFTLQLGAGGGFVDNGNRIAWAPRFRLGLGASW